MTESKYSHAAIVVKDPNFTEPAMTGLYCWESTGLEDVKDSEDGMVKFGVQMRELKEVVRTFKGDIYVRHLKCTRDETFYKNIADAHSVAHNRFYDVLPQDWIRALFDIHQGNVQRKRTFYCSALVAFVYTSCNLVPRSTPWTIIRPKDLGTEKGHRSDMHFINCSVEEEELIDYDLPYPETGKNGKWIELH